MLYKIDKIKIVFKVSLVKIVNKRDMKILILKVEYYIKPMNNLKIEKININIMMKIAA